jgi:A/G-specific adenine glycosylase
MTFFKQLLLWYNMTNHRQLPWRDEKDPYKIWLSEIILQQTRAEQGLPYYNKFIKTYATLQQLAAADDQAVFNLWQGLGYYSRCRNLLSTARYILSHHEGKLPNTYQQLLQLKGIGPYTAAAIASFAFNEPVAVVDGNVYRVLARIFGISTPIDSTEGKKEFASLAQQLLDKKNPALHNQAIMDFGASVCTPKKPNCVDCPFNRSCKAYLQNDIAAYPVKIKKLTVKTRYFHYLVFKSKDHILIQQRLNKDIWQQLWEFYLIETNDATAPKTNWLTSNSTPTFTNSQKLTHRTIQSFFYVVDKVALSQIKIEGIKLVKTKELNNYSFSKTCLDFLKNMTTFK